MFSCHELRSHSSRPGAQALLQRASHAQPRRPPVNPSGVSEMAEIRSSRGRPPLSESLAIDFDISQLLPWLFSSQEPALEHEMQDDVPPSDRSSTQPTVSLKAREQLQKLSHSLEQQADAILDSIREQTTCTVRQSNAQPKTKRAHRKVNAKHRVDRFGVAKSPMRSGYQALVDPSQAIKSPTANLEGLYSSFVDVYLARNRRGSVVTVVLSFLTVIPTILPSPVNALEEATRTLVLVSLGGATGNQALLQQAVQHYGKALLGLRRSIAHPQMTHYEHTFVAILILLMCSYHSAIRTVDNNWVQHMWGAQSYFIARHSECFQTQAGRLAILLARHTSLSYSLLARKGTIFAKFPPPKAALQDRGSRWANMLFEPALQIPTLLERHDAIMRPDQTQRACIEALDADCLTIERRLRTWYCEWATMCATQGISLFKEQDIECFSPFHVLCCDRTFTSAYSFSDFSYVFLAVFYCISLHLIVQTRGSLAVLRQKLIPHATKAPRNDSIATLYAEADLLAQDICMCIPFLCEEQCGISGYVAILLPLRVATIHFQKQEDADRLKWTNIVRKKVFVKGVTPPNVTYQRRT